MITAPDGSTGVPVQTGCGRNYIKIRWNSVPRADGYIVRGEDSAGHVYDEHRVSAPFARIRFQREDERYSVTVIPFRKQHDFAACGKAVRTGMNYPTLPAKTGNISLKKNRLDAGSAEFSWDPAGSADGYEISVTDAGGRQILRADTRKAQVRIKDSTLKQGTFYGIRVRGYAVTETGRTAGAWSDRLFFCGDAEGVRLRKKESEIDISWDQVKGAGSYLIYVSDRAPDRLSGMEKMKTVKANHFRLKKYRGKRLDPGRKYYITVVAAKKHGSRTFFSRPSKYYYIA